LRIGRERNCPFARSQPSIRVVGARQDRLKLIVIALRNRLELMLVATGALDRHSQKRRTDNLERVSQDLVNLVLPLIARVRWVAGSPQKSRRHELVDDFISELFRPAPLAQFVAGNLLADELVVRLVALQGPDHVIAIAPRLGALSIGIEVA